MHTENSIVYSFSHQPYSSPFNPNQPALSASNSCVRILCFCIQSQYINNLIWNNFNIAVCVSIVEKTAILAGSNAICFNIFKIISAIPRPRRAVGSESDCRSRDQEFDIGPVPYFRGDWSWTNLYGHSLSSADTRMFVVSYKWKYAHEVLVNCTGTSVVRWTDRLDMTIAIDWDVRHQTKQTNKTKNSASSLHMLPLPSCS